MPPLSLLFYCERDTLSTSDPGISVPQVTSACADRSVLVGWPGRLVRPGGAAAGRCRESPAVPTGRVHADASCRVATGTTSRPGHPATRGTHPCRLYPLAH